MMICYLLFLFVSITFFKILIGKYIVKFWDWSFHLKNRTITLTEDGTFKDIQDKLYAKEPDGNRIYSIKLKDTKYEFSPAYTQEELGLKL